MHLWLLLCTAGTAGLPWTRHWGLINTWPGPGVHHLRVRNNDLDRWLHKEKRIKRLSSADFQFKTHSVDSVHSGITINVSNRKLWAFNQ
jgi:hypothetical protein